MGRKGGGARGFAKARRGGAAADLEQNEDDGTSLGSAPPTETGAIGSQDVSAGVSSTSETNARLKASQDSAARQPAREAPADNVHDVDADDGEEDDDEPSSSTETRGQTLQRHKKEIRDLKEKAKKAGKKAKDEYKALEEAMLARHQEELKKFEEKQDMQIPDSLYGSQASDKKPTKALKRRQKQQEQEAAREEAIQAEVDEIGETDCAAEERQIAAKLLPLGLKIFEIPADGNCMYRALAHQCQALNMPNLINDVKASTLGQSVLRAKAAEYMRAHPDDFLPFIVDDSDVDPMEQLQRYCDKVESTTEWGTQVELQALAAALKMHIQVYNATMPVVEMGEEYKSVDKPSLQVCYQQHAFGSGEHYNSVVPIKLSLEDDDS